MIGITRRNALLGAVATPVLGLAVDAQLPAVPPSGQPAPVGLRADARLSHRFFGAAVQAEQLASDIPFRDAVVLHCDVVTPELELKWAAVQPAAESFDFARMDALAGFAHSTSKRLHGHTLLWHRSVPDWALPAMIEARNWDVVHRFFAAVIGRYDAVVDYWDVVNEPIDMAGEGDGLRRSPFYAAFGPEYVRRALDSARSLTPRARLLINDYGIEYTDHEGTARRRALLNLVDELRRQGAPLDGIGIQAHLDLQKGALDQAGLRDFLQELADRRLEILITELDVRETDHNLPFSERDRRVADTVRAFADVAMANPWVRGLTTWGLTDRYSWLNDDGHGRMIPGRNRGLPFDAALQPKPFSSALSEAFRQQPYIVPQTV